MPSKSPRGGRADAQDDSLAFRSRVSLRAVHIRGTRRGHQANRQRATAVRPLRFRLLPAGAVRSRLADALRTRLAPSPRPAEYNLSVVQADQPLDHHGHKLRQHCTQLFLLVDGDDGYRLVVGNSEQALAVNLAMGSVSHDARYHGCAGNVVPFQNADDHGVQLFILPLVGFIDEHDEHFPRTGRHTTLLALPRSTTSYRT